MNFLYFLSGATRSDLTDGFLEAAGLGYAFGSQTAQYREVIAAGPSGTTGLVGSLSADRLGYFVERQTWIPHPTAKFNDTAVWVGVENDYRPKPEQLERPNVLTGKDIELQDGNLWHAPLIRTYIEPDEALQTPGGYAVTLPRSMGVDSEAAARGEYKLTWDAIDARYAPLLDIAVEYYDWFASDGDDEKSVHRMDNAEIMTECAVKVLAANYRIGMAEATLLNLFDSRATYAQSVLNYSAIDWDNLSAWLKKNMVNYQSAVDDGSSTVVGSKESQCRDTARPMLTTSP